MPKTSPRSASSSSAAHRALNWLRSEERRKKREIAHAETFTIQDSPLDHDLLAHLDAAISELPDKQRIPLIAYYFQDQTQEAIAQELNLTRQGAAHRIQSAVSTLRITLKRQGITTTTGALTTLIAQEAASTPIPPTLSTSLGKLALQGLAPQPNLLTTLLAAGGTILAYKGKLAITTGLLLIAIFLYAFLAHKQPPNNTPTPTTPIAENKNDTSTNHDHQLQQESESSDNDKTHSSKQAPPAEMRTALSDKDPKPTKAEENSAPKKIAQISGYVMDEGAYAIAGAHVAIILSQSEQRHFEYDTPGIPLPTQTTSSDEQGYFQFNNVQQSDALLTATAVDYQTQYQTISVSDDPQENTVQLTLKEGHTLHGTVLTHTNTPIEGAIVMIMGSVEQSGLAEYGNTNNKVITDAKGVFMIGSKKEGSHLILKVSTPTQGETTFSDINIEEDSPVTLRIHPAATLSGTIIHPDGTPAPDIHVALQGHLKIQVPGSDFTVGAGADNRTATTDQNGQYHIDQLCTNVTYKANITTNDGSPLSRTELVCTAEAGKEYTWDYVLQSVIRVYGTVTGETSGTPISDLYIYSTPAKKTKPSRVTDEGYYELQLFEAGTYYIYPQYNSSRELTRELYGVSVELSANEERELNFKLPDPFTQSIHVIDQQGNPVGGATVDRRRKTPNGNISHGSGTTNAEGRYSHNLVSNFEAWFDIHKEGYIATHSTPIIGESCVVYPEETIILYATGGLEGQILLNENQPLANASIRITHYPTDVIPYMVLPQIETATDENGIFAMATEFPALPGETVIEIPEGEKDWTEIATVPNIVIYPKEITNMGTLSYAHE